MIEAWNGASWSIVASPDTSASQNNYLRGVSCVSSTSCKAVGNYNNGTLEQTLVESWNGTTWSIVACANMSGSSNYLDGISCTSSISCTAVGHYNNSGVDQTLAETWNGISWSIVATPNASNSQNNYLDDVSCVSSGLCTAVGGYYNGTHHRNQTLVETWGLRSWSIETSPNTSSSQENYLGGISCTSPTSCTAVGAYDNGNGTFVRTLVESWNATSWSIMASPNAFGPQNSFLSAVSCTSSAFCATVGYGCGAVGVRAVWASDQGVR